jgi:GT2 family glycosyltransferase
MVSSGRVPGDAPTVTAIVCTRDRPELLEQALRSVCAALRPSDELIVVDSASRTGEPAEVARAAGATVVRVELPGLTRARNAGLAAAAAPIVAFTDDDCVVASDWLECVEKAFLDPTVAFITGQVLPDTDRRLNISCIVSPDPRRFDADSDPFQCGTGANMSYRRDACQAIGGFDEYLGPGAPLIQGEEVDMFWRMLRAGRLGAYEPAASVRHTQWRSDRESIQLSYSYGIGAGAVATKMIRLRDPRGWPLLRMRLGKQGFGAAFRELFARHESAAAATALQGLGAARGATRAARLPLHGDVFGPNSATQARPA